MLWIWTGLKCCRLVKGFKFLMHQSNLWGFGPIPLCQSDSCSHDESVDTDKMYFNRLPDDKILDWSKMEHIADDMLKCN